MHVPVDLVRPSRAAKEDEKKQVSEILYKFFLFITLISPQLLAALASNAFLSLYYSHNNTTTSSSSSSSGHTFSTKKILIFELFSLFFIFIVSNIFTLFIIFLTTKPTVNNKIPNNSSTVGSSFKRYVIICLWAILAMVAYNFSFEIFFVVMDLVSDALTIGRVLVDFAFLMFILMQLYVVAVWYLCLWVVEPHVNALTDMKQTLEFFKAAYWVVSVVICGLFAVCWMMMVKSTGDHLTTQKVLVVIVLSAISVIMGVIINSVFKLLVQVWIDNTSSTD